MELAASPKKTLPILFQDQDLIVVNKRSGLLVHRTAIDGHSTEFAMQIVRDQIGCHVYPVHRLDRATSGALVFALSSKAARFLTQEFTEGRVGKNYLAVVRGFSPDTKLIDYPLKEITELKNKNEVKKSMPEQTAQTYIQTLAKIEINQCVDKFPTSRYSLVKAQPKTGRNHQIRRHLRHLGHPIIGDVNYGSGVHNRFFRQNYQSHRLLLACTEISFLHPTKNEVVHVKAPLAEDFSQLIDQLGWAYVG